jgi:hypothetical protein
MNRSSPISSTLAALAGVGFAVLFFLSFFITDPLREATDQELLAWWSDAGMLRDTIISMYLMLLAAPLFLVFLTQLCTRLRSAGDSAESWSGLVFGAGVAFVALLAVGAFTRGVLAQSIRFSDEPIPGPDTLRYATTLSQAALAIAAIPFAAVTIAFGSLIIVRTGALARWLGWLGLVVAAASLVTVILLVGGLAAPLIVLWVVAASVVIWRTRHAVAGDAPAQRGDVMLSSSVSANR